jgi:hypothetical protein
MAVSTVPVGSPWHLHEYADILECEDDFFFHQCMNVTGSADSFPRLQYVLCYEEFVCRVYPVHMFAANL